MIYCIIRIGTVESPESSRWVRDDILMTQRFPGALGVLVARDGNIESGISHLESRGGLVGLYS
jgi:hypothetical protein